MFEFNTVFTIFIMLFIGFVTNNDENIVSVRLKSGLINGKIEESVDGKKVNVFRGIPYAQPPVGQLRFKKPLPVKEWPQTLDAYDWPNPCYQNINKSIMHLRTNNVTEDCLYLNVWTPIDSLKSAHLKSVIFYIHGGAFIWGSAFNTGAVLTTKGDVVVIHIQHRLSTFGFLYSGTEEAPGNVGLLDQALALEWVKDNIEYFGGDPNRITIMGLSSGSMSASLHIMSPITRNMFRNAIMQSGAMTDHMINGKPEDRLKEWLKGAQLIGCNDEDSEEFTPKILECLRSADPNILTEIPELPELKYRSIRPSFSLVVVDGQFLPKNPSEMLRSGDYNQKINLMVGTAADEASLLVSKYDSEKYNFFNPKNLTFDQTFNELKRLSSLSSEVNAINGEEVAKFYYMGLSQRSDPDLLRRTIGVGLGDYYLGCPTILFAKEVFRNSNFKSNVYQYYFNSKIEGKGSFFAKWWGPSHAEDLPATFGRPFYQFDLYSDRDRQISQQMIEIIAEFAKNDEAPPQSGVKWQKFYTIDDNIIGPYYEFTNKPKTDSNFGVGLKINECEYLWKKYII